MQEQVRLHALAYLARTNLLDARGQFAHVAVIYGGQDSLGSAIPGRDEKAVKWGWECESFCAWLRCRHATSQESDLRSDRGTPDRAV